MANSIAKGLQALGETTPLPDGAALSSGRKPGIAGACRAGIIFGIERNILTGKPCILVLPCGDHDLPGIAWVSRTGALVC
jgi:hypothetical protein